MHLISFNIRSFRSQIYFVKVSIDMNWNLLLYIMSDLALNTTATSTRHGEVNSREDTSWFGPLLYVFIRYSVTYVAMWQIRGHQF